MSVGRQNASAKLQMTLRRLITPEQTTQWTTALTTLGWNNITRTGAEVITGTPEEGEVIFLNKLHKIWSSTVVCYTSTIEILKLTASLIPMVTDINF